MKKLLLILIITFNNIITAQTAWYGMGQGASLENDDYHVFSVVISTDRVYIGGAIKKMINSDNTEVLVNNICWYDWQGNYHSMQGGIVASWGQRVAAVTLDYHNTLWVGGTFDNAVDDNNNPVPNTQYLAQWKNNQWQAPPFTVDGIVWAIYVAPNGDVYLGGNFRYATQGSNHLLVMGLVRWDGNQIHRVSGGVDISDYVDDFVGCKAITMDNYGQLIVGGNFQHAFNDDGNGGGDAVDGTHGIACLLSNNTWQAFGQGIRMGAVRALAVDEYNNIYVGHSNDEMLDADGNLVPYTKSIARWNNQWYALGQGLNQIVYTLKISGNDMYVGGYFTTAYRTDGSAVSHSENMVKWKTDLDNWYSLTSQPPDDRVYCLDFRDGKMVVGGIYANAGGIHNSHSITYFTDNENPLPVELTTFTATAIGNKVELNWQTATEVNNYGFDVERSSSRQVGTSPVKTWQKIGFVSGHGNSNSIKLYSFVDNSVDNNDKYFYRLKQIDINGSYEYSDVVEVNFEIPGKFTLTQNYPNPFNPTTTIQYSIPIPPQPSLYQGEGVRVGLFVSLKVYDILGNEVATLVNEEKQPGYYTVTFNANGLASGIYFYRLTAGKFVQTKKMILIR